VVLLRSTAPQRIPCAIWRDPSSRCLYTFRIRRGLDGQLIRHIVRRQRCTPCRHLAGQSFVEPIWQRCRSSGVPVRVCVRPWDRKTVYGYLGPLEPALLACSSASRDICISCRGRRSGARRQGALRPACQLCESEPIGGGFGARLRSGHVAAAPAKGYRSNAENAQWPPSTSLRTSNSPFR
jgi:hypothetical protein